MIGRALLLGLVGLALSAFFSGAETGLYRATRLRLVLDALGGSLVARGLLWLANNPSLFVATTLLGNNIAHYLVSLAMVLAGQSLEKGSGVVDVLLPLIVTPTLFVYGELVPKSLFLAAPNRLLRYAGPGLLFFAVLFAPLSGLIWMIDRLLQRLLRHSPEQVQATLARRELQRILAEGREAGILLPSQQALAQGLFAAANQPVGPLITPLNELPRARAGASVDEVLGLAQRYRLAIVPVEAARDENTSAPRPDQPRALAGYVRVLDWALNDGRQAPPVVPLLRISETTTLLAAITTLQTAGEDIAAVVDGQGRTLGIVSADQLRGRLLQAGQ